MRFPPVEDIPNIETVSIDINELDNEMHTLLRDVRFAITHNPELSRRSRELVSSLDDLLLQQSYTHQSMRLLLRHAYRKEDYPVVADTVSLAREQVEKIYQTVLILQGPHKWLRQYLRNAWQKNYEEYLLERDEFGASERHREHIYDRYPEYLDSWRRLKLKPSDSILVSNFAVKVVEYDWNNRSWAKPTPKPAWFKRRGSIGHFLRTYFYFPTPWDVMTKVRNRQLFVFLDRWYREYKRLSEYSHVLMGKIVPQRIGRDKSVANVEKLQIYGRKHAEAAILASNIAAASLWTVVMPYLRNSYGSRTTTREYWERLAGMSLLAKSLWNLYPSKILK